MLTEEEKALMLADVKEADKANEARRGFRFADGGVYKIEARCMVADRDTTKPEHKGFMIAKKKEDGTWDEAKKVRIDQLVPFEFKADVFGVATFFETTPTIEDFYNALVSDNGAKAEFNGAECQVINGRQNDNLPTGFVTFKDHKYPVATTKRLSLTAIA